VRRNRAFCNALELRTQAIRRRQRAIGVAGASEASNQNFELLGTAHNTCNDERENDWAMLT